ncbi:MAG: o-succinylbenzoate synthase [Lacunisphaera sp.]|nr:o-succinylbenzoate synthase [Lacunisphaera sp.]
MVYRFSYKPYCRSLRAPLRTAHGLWTEREGLVVRLEDEAGEVGFGEIAPLSWFGTETLVQAEEVCRKFGDRAGDALLDEVPEKFGCVRFALAQARVQDKKRPEAAVHRLPVAALLPAGRDALPLMRQKIEAGFLAFKWKVGVGDINDELGLLDDLLSTLPGHARLRLDANGAWTRRQAERWLTRCAERPVEFVEQPVAPADENTLLGLAGDYPVKLALDESVVRLADARRWQGLGWPGVFVVKPSLAGPLTELAEWILATKADVVISSAIETALGRSAVLRAALSQPLTTRALGFGTGEIFGERLWDGPIIGPLADASCIAEQAGEGIWNALTTSGN